MSPIFNKDSFEVFKEELMAFWKGRTSFVSEAINLTLTGMSKNILIYAIIAPGGPPRISTFDTVPCTGKTLRYSLYKNTVFSRLHKTKL